jgi:membrane protease YdiL (CAAX protease family)
MIKKKHTAIQTVLLHLVPGIIQLFVFIALIPLVHKLGFASDFADHLVTIVAMVPIQFGILLFVTKKTTGTYCIASIIPYKKKSKLLEYLIFTVIILVWVLGINALISPWENGLRDSLFSFVPAIMRLGNANTVLFSKNILIISACLGVLTNGIIAPVTEELYFRGYLLPRINLSPQIAVVANSLLFSLYHFFSPWYFLSRVLMTLPIYFWVMRRKNIRFSIIVHIIVNVFTSGTLFLQIINA